MKRFSTGLVVGKFAPLHKGHEFLIATALSQCNQVVVLSYSKPELPGCEPQVRQRWLETLFPECKSFVLSDEWLRARSANYSTLPTNDADASLHHDLVWHIAAESLGFDVDAVFTSEDYGDGFARSLTRLRREATSGAPAVVHVSVDASRLRVPVSGTQVRANVHEHRRLLHPVVYASFVERVALLGGESSGKSTLARALAEHFATEFVAEYGRHHWESKGGQLEFVDMLHIAETQVAHEEAALLRARRYLFCDTTPLTTAHYSRVLFGSVDPALSLLAERPYRLVVMCEPDFAFVQDGTRRDALFRAEQHEAYEDALRARGVPYLTARGSVAERVATVAAALSAASQG